MAYQPKSYKKFVATAATATLVASAVAPVASASFTDVNSNYKDAVNYLVNTGIANGMSETTFGVSSVIKRGDAAVMIANALGLDTTTAPDAGFKDLNARVAGAVNAIVKAGIANGKTETTFAPDAAISRQEMAKMLANAYGLTATTNASFKDVNSNWLPYVSALVEAGVAFGYNDTTFGSTDSVTRGQFALFVYRAEGSPAPAPAVASLNFNTEGNEFTLMFGTALPENADLEYVLENYDIEVNGSAITTAQIDALKLSIKSVSADMKTVVVSHTDLDDLATTFGGTSVMLQVGGKSAIHTFDLEAKVSSVMAMNAKELVVKFNTAVNKADAELLTKYSLAGVTFTGTPVVSEDGKTVTLTTAGELKVTNAKLTVNPIKTKADANVLTSEYNTLLTFSDSTAPAVSGSVKAVGTTAEFTFNEPLLDQGTVSVNGVETTNFTLAGHKLTVAGLEAEKTYTVTIVGATDFANNIATSISSTFTVAKPVVDSLKPTVTSSVNGTKITVDFSEELVATNNIFANVNVGGTNFSLTASEQDANDETKFTFDAATVLGSNNFVNTTMTVSAYKDVAGNAGDNFTSNVTLAKDVTNPTFVGASSKILVADDKNASTDVDRVVLTFSEPVNVNGSLTLKSKNGIVYSNGQSVSINNVASGFDVDGNGKVEGSEANAIAVAVDLDESTSYTFELSAGSVKDLANNAIAAATTVSFTSGTFSATAPVPTKTLEFDDVTRFNNSNTQLVVDFNKTVTSSALNAANYTLDGKALPTGTTLSFLDGTEMVLVTLPAGSITANGQYQFTAKNVVATNGDTLKGDQAVKFVSLVENVSPSATTVSVNNSSSVTVDFTEAVSTALNAAVTGVTVKVNGNTVNATLTVTNGDLVVTGLNFGMSDSVTVEFKSTNLQDANANKVKDAVVSK